MLDANTALSGNENIVTAVLGPILTEFVFNQILINRHLSYFQFPFHKQWVLKFQFSPYWSSAICQKFSYEFSRENNEQLDSTLSRRVT